MREVSVVVPYHNDAATIGRTLDSIAAQTERPREVVVVDDASRPDQASALDELAAGWDPARPPLVVRHLQPNQGPAAARNEGWALASGEWVAFCDADDVWHPRRLAVQLDAADDAALISALRAPAPEAMDAPAPGSPIRVRTITRAGLLAVNQIMTSGVLVRREIASRFTAGRRYTEDYELWLRILLGGGRTIVVGHPLFAPQVPDGEASGLTTHRWAMTTGEWETYRLVRADGLVSRAEYALALAVSAVRAARRHGLVALAGLRGRPRR